jgi:hypothetical protein
VDPTMVEEERARDGGGGAEKLTSIDGGGGRGFTVYRSSGDDRADGAVLGRCDGVDPTVVQAVGEAPVWTHRRWRQRWGLSNVERSTWENLAAYRRQV